MTESRVLAPFPVASDHAAAQGVMAADEVDARRKTPLALPPSGDAPNVAVHSVPVTAPRRGGKKEVAGMPVRSGIRVESAQARTGPPGLTGS